MYYPEGKPRHHKQGGVKFLPPHGRVHKPTEAFCLGGDIIGVYDDSFATRVWRAWVDGDKVKLQKEGDSIVHELFTRADLWYIDLAFDQTNRPVVTYQTRGRSGYYHYSVVTSNYDDNPLPEEVRFPSIFLDRTTKNEIPRSDLIISYSHGGKLYHLIQRFRYRNPVELANVPVKSLVHRSGRTRTGLIAYQWR